ncbi:hypothetical protein [Catenuloplanes atrovinosus]|uniref:SH3 domain-containing protein n=1 Tax=Catenuloplanes atrovinosus TaxID=137266 RepID=A0AAE3YIN7_9ACTN|nr:hypothetical protein [Catenuloplanes atrovinosus]MDR7274444.1 hypothetical protein [Catenuloplanes atrovinosus]
MSATATCALGAALNVAATAAPARASVAECTNGANGFVSIPYHQSGTVRRSIHLGANDRALITLQSATIQGLTRGYAKISGSTRVGDQVWMDWTTTGGNGWLQCGPWYVRSDGAPNTSAAQRTDPSSQWLFRACGLVDGEGGCTGWW